MLKCRRTELPEVENGRVKSNNKKKLNRFSFCVRVCARFVFFFFFFLSWVLKWNDNRVRDLQLWVVALWSVSGCSPFASEDVFVWIWVIYSCFCFFGPGWERETQAWKSHLCILLLIHKLFAHVISTTRALRWFILFFISYLFIDVEWW